MIHADSQPDPFLTRFTNGEPTASSDTASKSLRFTAAAD